MTRRAGSTWALLAITGSLLAARSAPAAAPPPAPADSAASSPRAPADSSAAPAAADTLAQAAVAPPPDSLAARARADSLANAAAPALSDTTAASASASAPPVRPESLVVAPATPFTGRWALVLSGGLARGFAHGGVIRALEDVDVRPDLVVGSSMGGIVGAMYAAGYSPDSLRAVLRTIPWDLVFGGVPNAYQWRSVWPRPWLELAAGAGHGLQIPPSIVDNTVINQVLTELFLNADAEAQGDFDKLPIPFRAIGTDVRTGRWHMLASGSLARACRITAGIPLLFPPVADGDLLLVDGGMSSNLPISPARTAGAERVLAVEVAIPPPHLDESSSGITVFLQLWDLLNKRGQDDTLSTAAGDTLVWLKLDGQGPSDLAGGGRIMEAGYQEGGAAVRSWALRSGLPKSDSPLTPPQPLMPPLAEEVRWLGRSPVRRASIARAVLGKLPQGEFRPTQLVAPLRRLARSGLFESAWPTLTRTGDSTVLSFEVRERPELLFGPAFALQNDEGPSLHLGATWRPLRGPFPSLVRAGWGVRSLGWNVHASVEPYSLDHGSWGWFARGRYHEMRERVFDAGEVKRYLRTHRFEIFGGGQLPLFQRQVVQAGLGVARISRPSPPMDGFILAARSQSLGGGERSLDAEWMPGDSGYARVQLDLDVDLRWRSFVLTPGARWGAVSGEAPPDALVGLGGPHSLSGLQHEEWLGREAGVVSLELGFEMGRQARVYLAGQSGVVREPVSGFDLGPDVVSGVGVGGEVQLPIGKLLIETGASTAGRRRLDFFLGTRF